MTTRAGVPCASTCESKDGRALRVRTRDGYFENMRGGTR